MRPDTMLTPATVADFLAKLPVGSATAYRPALNRKRAASLGVGRGFNAGGGRTERQPPYADAEREALFAAASRSRSAKGRRHLEAFLFLGFGAGVLGVEMGWVRPDDIRPWGGRLWCDIWRGPPGDPATLDRPALQTLVDAGQLGSSLGAPSLVWR